MLAFFTQQHYVFHYDNLSLKFFWYEHIEEVDGMEEAYYMLTLEGTNMMQNINVTRVFSQVNTYKGKTEELVLSHMIVQGCRTVQSWIQYLPHIDTKKLCKKFI